jgi:predicted membrane channel-forming protein YqfA (hemolysin III family)
VRPHLVNGVTVNPAQFVLPGGPLIPVLAIAVSMMILLFANRTQLTAGGVALLVGAVFYFIATRGAHATARS